jgi:hypothetical protein
MGYSIAIRCRSEQLRKRMLRFMKENFVPADKLFSSVDMAAAPGVTTDMSYDEGKTGLGFDYSAWVQGEERAYICTVLRWMALKIGRRRTWRKRWPEYGPLPHYVYDGYDAVPIFLESPPKDYVKTDQYGCQRLSKFTRMLLRGYGRQSDPRKVSGIIRAEMRRLDKLWEGSLG